MGKAALILVAAVSIGSGAAYMSINRSSYEAEIEEALYEHGVLAREIAESGFNVLISRVKGDFDHYRVLSQGDSRGAGSLDVSAAGSSGGPVTVTATGYFGGAEFSMTGVLDRTTTRILDALTLDGDTKKIELKDDVQISGLDQNRDGSSGSGGAVHGILTTSSDAASDVLEAATDEGLSDQITGMGLAPDVYQGAAEVDLSALATTIYNYSGAERVYHDEEFKLFDSMTIGSPLSPAVVVVDDKATLKDNATGYGILYVNGDLKMEKSARWEGLIVVNGPEPKVELTEDALILGALVVRTVPESGGGGSGDGGLAGGHFDVDVFDRGSKIYHEHQYDDDFDRTDVDLLEIPNACKDDGALCWDEVLSSVSRAFVSFFNHENSSGAYRVKAGCSPGDDDDDGGCGDDDDDGGVSAVDLSGDPSDGLSATLMDVSRMEEFWVDFDALCSLIESSPGDVQGDDDNRNGAFSIRIHEAQGGGDDDDDGGPVQGDLLYELSVYHHTGDDFPCEGGDGGGGDDEVVASEGDPFEVKMEKNARIQYSSSVLGDVLDLLGSEYEMSGSAVSLTSVSSSGVRATRATGIVHN